MTREQAKIKIRHNLNDAGITYYSDSDLNDSIQDGYDEIVVTSECIEKFFDLTPSLIAGNPEMGKPWLNLSLVISDYYRITNVLHRTTGNFLSPVADRENDEYDWNWQVKNHTVWDYVINGVSWIGFPGQTYQGIENFRIFYKAQAPILQTDADSFKINVNYQKLLEIYGTADLLEQNQEFSKASNYWLEYDRTLEEYRYKVQLLSKADRTFTRE